MTVTKNFWEERTLTLAGLLEIDETRIPRRCSQAMSYLEHRWQEIGSPSRPESLREMLDQAIKFCTENEMRYPKVVLLRLKQLQRREWTPSCTATIQ